MSRLVAIAGSPVFLSEEVPEASVIVEVAVEFLAFVHLGGTLVLLVVVQVAIELSAFVFVLVAVACVFLEVVVVVVEFFI